MPGPQIRIAGILRLVSLFNRCAIGVLCFVLIGCSAANVTPEEVAAPPPPTVADQRPAKIVVYDFQVSAENVTENQGPIQKLYRSVSKDEEQQEADKLATGRAVAHDLSMDLVKQLQQLGFNAENLPRETPVDDNALVIDGQFLTADEGNRARRLIIGFGAGASKLDTQVIVSQISGGGTSQLLNFKTHADSGKMPGAAVTMGAGAAAQGATVATAGVGVATGAAKAYGSMLSTLADKTAKQINAYLSQYFASRGWISPDQAKKVTLTE